MRTNEIVDKVVTGVFGGNVETDQSSNRAKMQLAAFSQQQELAADKEGIQISGKAGFDPHAAARFLGYLQSQKAAMLGESGAQRYGLTRHRRKIAKTEPSREGCAWLQYRRIMHRRFSSRSVGIYAV